MSSASKLERLQIPPVSEWVNKPIFVRPSPHMRSDEIDYSELGEEEIEPPIDIHLNGGTETYRFFSNHFLGKASLLIKGVNNCPASYFR